MAADGKHTHILYVFPGFGAGGAQMRTVQLMGMWPEGTRHTVMALNGNVSAAEHIPAGVLAEMLPRPPQLSFFAMGRHMASEIESRRPDLVMTHNWGSIEAVLGARRSGFRRLIHHEDGFGPEEMDRCYRRRIWIRRWLLRSAAAVAVPSLVLQRMARAQWKVSEDRLHYLPNGVDLERFAPAVAPRTDELVFCTAGRLSAEKNQALLIEAFADARCRSTARVRIYGAGAEEARLRSLAAERGVEDRVEFCGHVGDTAPIYRNADAFVLTSDTEQMPLTVLEAMASGLPVVATDVGDVASMVDASNRGWITPRRDREAMTGALDEVADQPALRREVGAANRARAEQEFDTDARYRAWMDFYRAELSRG